MTKLKNKTIDFVLICIVIGYFIPCLKCKGVIKMQEAGCNNTSNNISKRQEKYETSEVNLSRPPPGQTTLLDRTRDTSKTPKRTRNSTSKKRKKTIRNTTKVHETTGKLITRKKINEVAKSQSKLDGTSKIGRKSTKSSKNCLKNSKRRTVGLGNISKRSTTTKTTTAITKATKVVQKQKSTVSTQNAKRKITKRVIKNTKPTMKTTSKKRKMSRTTRPMLSSTLIREDVMNIKDFTVDKQTTYEPNYMVIGAALFEDAPLKNASETTESIIKAARNKFSQLFKSEPIGKSSVGIRKISKNKIEKRNDTDFLPKLMIFETDGVFWSFMVETDVVPPFGMSRYQPTTKKRRTKTSWWSDINPNYGVELYDRNGTELRLFPDTSESLIKLYKKGIKMAVAMTTTEIATVRHLLHLFDLDHLFFHMEIDVESVLSHVIGIKEELGTGMEFSDIVYLGTNKTLLEELKRNLKILTVFVNPEKGLHIMHIYRAIYIYNLRPLLSVTKGQISLKGELVSDEVNEENPSKEIIPKPTPQKKPRSSSRVKMKTAKVGSTTEANL